MSRLILAALGALAIAALGLFWLNGPASVEAGAPPPEPSVTRPDTLPTADVRGLTGPAPPEATELSDEQRRFFRYDRDRDQKITRNEMLSTRTAAFRALDVDGNNLLTFEEWAIATSRKFEGADADGNGELTPAEFRSTAPKQRPGPRCRC
ncbi:EF-hand domain-containing protein [Croceibacterium ferulae]|uniref:EF-hand domain-containing protein n=1 Tax=Croceibacterium ferulae TaxID=1854641 RepID=UPI000EB04245|nr:EF-hand domain-containing protein [Croceibacterium ferulae]